MKKKIKKVVIKETIVERGERKKAGVKENATIIVIDKR